MCFPLLFSSLFVLIVMLIPNSIKLHDTQSSTKRKASDEGLFLKILICFSYRLNIYIEVMGTMPKKLKQSSTPLPQTRSETLKRKRDSSSSSDSLLSSDLDTSSDSSDASSCSSSSSSSSESSSDSSPPPRLPSKPNPSKGLNGPHISRASVSAIKPKLS